MHHYAFLAMTVCPFDSEFIETLPPLEVQEFHCFPFYGYRAQNR